MAYFSTEPASEHRNPTGRNRVWDFFRLSNETHLANRLQPLQRRRKIRDTATKPVSGIPYWPSRDPIGEDGGANLYGFVGNNGAGKFDVLGNVPWVAIFARTPWAIVAYGIYYDIDLYCTGSECYCEALTYSLLQNERTIYDLGKLIRKAEGNAGGDLIELPELLVAGVLGGVGVVTDKEAASISNPKNCSKEDFIKEVRKVRAKFESTLDSTAFKEGVARISLDKVSNEASLMTSANAIKFLTAMVERQKKMSEAIMKESAKECYDK